MSQPAELIDMACFIGEMVLVYGFWKLISYEKKKDELPHKLYMRIPDGSLMLMAQFRYMIDLNLVFLECKKKYPEREYHCEFATD